MNTLLNSKFESVFRHNIKADASLSSAIKVRSAKEGRDPVSIDDSIGHTRLHPYADASIVAPDMIGMRTPEKGHIAATLEAIERGGSRIIVSTNETIENSSHGFNPFPLRLGESIIHDQEPYDASNPVKITLMKTATKQPSQPTDGLSHLQVSEYEIEMNGQKYTIARIHMRNWTDLGEPDTSTLIALHETAGELAGRFGPILSVHCHGGVGRTGTAILALQNMRELDRSVAGAEDKEAAIRQLGPFNHVKAMIDIRSARNAVQGIKQLEAIKMATVDYARKLAGLQPLPKTAGRITGDKKETVMAGFEKIHPAVFNIVSMLIGQANKPPLQINLEGIVAEVAGVKSSNDAVMGRLGYFSPFAVNVNNLFGFDKVQFDATGALTEDSRQICKIMGVSVEKIDADGQLVPKSKEEIEQDVLGHAYHVSRLLDTGKISEKVLSVVQYLVLKNIDAVAFDRKVRNSSFYKIRYPESGPSPMQLLLRGETDLLQAIYPESALSENVRENQGDFLKTHLESHLRGVSEALPDRNLPRNFSELGKRWISVKLKPALDQITVTGDEFERINTEYREVLNLLDQMKAQAKDEKLSAEEKAEIEARIREGELEIVPSRNIVDAVNSYKSTRIGRFISNIDNYPEPIQAEVSRFIQHNQDKLLDLKMVTQEQLDSLPKVESEE